MFRLKNKTFWKSQWSNVCFKAWSDWQNILSQTRDNCPSVWVEGSLTFVFDMIKEVEKRAPLSVRIGVCQAGIKDKPSKQWKVISHQEVGGLTDGWFQVYLSFENQNLV